MAELEGALEMYECDGGFSPPDIQVGAEDVAKWLAAAVGAFCGTERGWVLSREGILGRVRLTVEVLGINA